MDAIPDSVGEVNTEAGKRIDFLHRGVRNTNGEDRSKAGETLEMARPVRQTDRQSDDVEQGMYGVQVFTFWNGKMT